METRFYILLSLKTPEGFVVYGQYFLGDDQAAVDVLFDSLQGSRTMDDASLLHIDLMETVNQLPVKVKTKCCRLDELTANVKLIVKDIFRRQNLKELN